MGIERSPADRSWDSEARDLLPPAPGERGARRRAVVLDRGDPDAVAWAAEALAAGQVIALPTDTVYGLAASLSHPAALERVFTIKRRPRDKPLPVLIAAAEDLERIALDLDPRVATLLDRYWPGPLTVVVPARAGMPPAVLGADGTVGARAPNHPLALQVIEQVGGSLAVTSANLAGEPPARTAGDALASLGDEVDLILDGGPTPGGVPSTVVAFSPEGLLVLRDGPIPREHLEAGWREIVAGTR